ncbi:MAG: hypothetical protein KDA21_07910, partial [Phycisphaerales bacterium]|nr:hypothetical protein [Phycisphaerales bacterium]
QQVLMNIVLNAVDAMEEIEAPRLEIRTFREDGECVIEISDNGPGIPTAQRERIFRPFYTTKPPGSGTGLGLAISVGLMRDNRGRMVAGESAAGGARFQVRLPLEPEMEPVAGKDASAVVTGQ